MALKLKISQEQYSYLENKQKVIPESQLANIASILEISITQLKIFDPDSLLKNAFRDAKPDENGITRLLARSHESEIEAYKSIVRVLKEQIVELRKRLE